MVVKRVLVVIPVGGGGSVLEQLFGELQHVVGIAGFRCGDRQLGSSRPGFLAGVVEMLGITVAAEHQRMVVMHDVPEVRCRGVEPGAFGIGSVQHRCDMGMANDLRNVRVGVQAIELVHMVHERGDEPIAVENFRKFKVSQGVGIPAGQRQAVDFREGFVHAAPFLAVAVIGAEHRLDLRGIETIDAPAVVVGHRDRDIERLLVAAMDVGVHQPGHDLVDGVKRHRCGTRIGFQRGEIRFGKS